MKVGSLFAGIGGFDLGFERAGFEVAWCVEWDKNAQAVLRKRFPNAQVYGDIREVDPDKLERVDIICGGFPCQDLSVAGKRAGLAGERSGLFHDAMRIVRQLRPSVLILENVPGLLSSNRGLDFATVLREVGEGWDCAEVGWRVLDSQYFGVAQRRRRVFIVAGSRVGCAEQILALAEGGGGNPPSRDKAREGTPADAGEGFENPSIVPALTSKMAKGTGGPSGDECQNLVVGTIDMQACKGNANIGDGSVSPTLCKPSGNDCHAVVFHPTQDPITSTGATHALGCGSKQVCATVAVCIPTIVRRLTPVECERLQGFPDGWTQIGTDKPTADTHRYKQLGNAVTVNVAEWIARRTMAWLMM
jgi:DNA (cytosine-5)-methyltransferase 1